MEGLIGAGKSTILKKLQEYLPFILPDGWKSYILYENVNEWISDGSLEFSYENPKKGIFPLQIKSIMSKKYDFIIENKGIKNDSFIENKDKSIIFIERSVYSAHFIFGEMHYEKKNLTSHEWKLCSELYNIFKNQIDYCFYIDVPPIIAFERLNIRNRHAEKTLGYPYLVSLEQKYKEHFPTKVPFPVKNINGKLTIDEIVDEISKTILHILRFTNDKIKDTK